MLNISKTSGQIIMIFGYMVMHIFVLSILKNHDDWTSGYRDIQDLKCHTGFLSIIVFLAYFLHILDYVISNCKYLCNQWTHQHDFWICSAPKYAEPHIQKSWGLDQWLGNYSTFKIKFSKNCVIMLKIAWKCFKYLALVLVGTRLLWGWWEWR